MAITIVQTSSDETSSALPQRPLRRMDRGVDPFPEIDGSSPEIGVLKQHMRLVAKDSFITALILGESGTGKERVASSIHRASARGHAPFVIINCAGFSPTLAEDQLFGHVRGAFTGAVTDQPAPFERANSGTIFLDEVGELPPEVQIKLLRALQQRTVQRLGGVNEIAFDVRVLAATNVDLARAVARRQFREDLYYRLKGYELHIPSLRRRGNADIRVLSESLLRQLTKRRHIPSPAIEPSVFHLFAEHQWPGNVRELENVLECMIVAADGAAVLTTSHLPDSLLTRGMSTRCAAARPRRSPDEIRDALRRNGFKCSRAAADLGLSRHQLYRRLKKADVSAVTEAS
jgi:transcriptional regulator with PAS, ATPase and Fis domain